MRAMTEFLSNRLKTLASNLGLLTNQEARLLTLVMGLLLLGLAVRYAHLRSEKTHPVKQDLSRVERTSNP
jgi:hypothetical protein